MRAAVSVFLLWFSFLDANCMFVAGPSTAAGSPAPIQFQPLYQAILAPVQVNGSGPLWFLLDTGARHTQIDERRARALWLDRNGATVEIGGARVEHVNIRAVSFDDLNAQAGRRVDGLLGSDFLEHFVVEINYGEHTLNFYDPNTYRYVGSEKQIPIRVSNDSIFVHGQIEVEGRGAVEGEFQVDTGYGGTLELNVPFNRQYGLLTKVGHTVSKGGWGAEGGYDEFIGRVKAFQLGRFTLTNPLVDFPMTTKNDFGRSDFAGLLGGKILGRFKLILDYSHQWLVLESNSHFAEPFEWDMSGADFVTEGKDLSTYRVSRVVEHSPAAECGLRKGDVLIEVDGHPAGTLGLMAINDLFQQEGREFVLAVRRNKQHLEMNLKTRRLI
jgi:hypothetical protein